MQKKSKSKNSAAITDLFLNTIFFILLLLLFLFYFIVDTFICHWPNSQSSLLVFVFYCLTVKEEVIPTFQNRSIKLANTLPSVLPVVESSTTAVPLVNNRKGSLLPLAPPSQSRLSLAGLNRARSLPGKYCYRPSSLSSTHCRWRLRTH